MLQEMVHPQDQHLSIEEIGSPIGNHILEFSESDLFPETMQNSEVGSSSNCNYEKHSYQIQLSNITDMSSFNTSIDNEIQQPPPSSIDGSSSGTIATATNSNMPTLFDDPTNEDDIDDNDISAAIDFTASPSFAHHQFTSSSNNNNGQEPFDISSFNNQIPLGDMTPNGSSSLHNTNPFSSERWSTVAPPPAVVSMMAPPPLSTSYEEECMSSFMRMKSSQPACSFIDSMMVPCLPPFSTESSGSYLGAGLMTGSDISHQDLEFQGDNSSLFISDNMQRVFNCSSDLQVFLAATYNMSGQELSNESQQLYYGGATTTTTSTLSTEISSLEDPTFKVGKLSVEDRKRKIHRYMKKRNERNFSKKIKYACRKTLADSRPRVRGRFAKNDELGEVGRDMGNDHEDDVDEEDVGIYSSSITDHQRKVVVKEEDGMDSSDILAHISGVNSFKCNYPIQSWI